MSTNLTEFLASINSSELLEISSTFMANVNDVQSMVFLPLTVIVNSQVDQIIADMINREQETISQAVRDELTKYNHGEIEEDKIDEIRNSVTDKVKETMIRRFSPDGDIIKKIEENAIHKFSVLHTQEIHRSAIRVQLFAGITSIWTAFECLAKDIWIASLNSQPIKLGHKAWSQIPQESSKLEGLSSKSITVGLLARYGFDIRMHLGTILSQQFDFTGVNGIRKAYESAFGKVGEFDDIFGEIKLSHLEATRHLIVHKAGVIDESFKSRVTSISATGERIDVNIGTVKEFIDVVINSGCKLISFVDGKI